MNEENKGQQVTDEEFEKYLEIYPPKIEEEDILKAIENYMLYTEGIFVSELISEGSYFILNQKYIISDKETPNSKKINNFCGTQYYLKKK